MVGALLLATILAGQAAAPEREHPTARETYVACNLFLRGVHLENNGSDRDWLGTSGCYWVAIRALSEHSWSPDSTITVRRPYFCPPDSFTIHDVRPLASAWLPWFERHARRIAGRPAFPEFLQAMIARWPCTGRGWVRKRNWLPSSNPAR